MVSVEGNSFTREFTVNSTSGVANYDFAYDEIASIVGTGSNLTVSVVYTADKHYNATSGSKNITFTRDDSVVNLVIDTPFW